MIITNNWILIGLLLVSSAQADDTSIKYARKATFLDIEINGNIQIAVGEQGLILRSELNSSSQLVKAAQTKNSNKSSQSDWQVIPSNISTTLTAVSALDNKIWFAVGHNSKVLFSNDAGKTWQEKIITEADPLAPWLEILTVAPSTVVLIGAYGQSALSVDAGKTWRYQPLTEEAEFHLNAAMAFDKTHWLVVGEAGQVYATKNAGAKWENINSPYEGSFFEVQPINDDQILIAGLRGNAFVGSGFAKWKAEQIAEPIIAKPIDDKIALESSSKAQLILSENNAYISDSENSSNIINDTASSQEIIQWQRLPLNEVETWFGSAVIKNNTSNDLILAGSRGSIINFPLQNLGTTNSYTIKKTSFSALSSIAIDTYAQIIAVGSSKSLQPNSLMEIQSKVLSKEVP
ncbi:MAG: YCF48-related protein [Pseudomonadota bacterium]